MWQKSISLFLCTTACFNKIWNNQDPELPPWCSNREVYVYGRMLSSHHKQETLCVERLQTHTGEPSPFTWCQTLLPAFSYQKKILERRLAEADGLSFASFRTGSMPPNSNSKPKTFSSGSVAEGYRSTLGKDKKSTKRRLPWTPGAVSVTLAGIQGITAVDAGLRVRWTERCVTPPAGRRLADRSLHHFFSAFRFN